MENVDTLIIVWAVVIAAAIAAEFLTMDVYSAWFAGGGLVAMILAACGVALEWQLIVFVVLSIALLFSLRPLVMKFIKNETTPTNLDANIGKHFKLLGDVVEGRSTIKIHDVVWSVQCGDLLKSGSEVVVTGIDGNKYIVEKKGG